jgi:hypothetical protein
MFSNRTRAKSQDKSAAHFKNRMDSLLGKIDFDSIFPGKMISSLRERAGSLSFFAHPFESKIAGQFAMAEKTRPFVLTWSEGRFILAAGDCFHGL